MATNTATQDSDDLEALFDSIIAANNDEAKHGGNCRAGRRRRRRTGKVINQIGHMARVLHDTLRELGLNKEIEKAARPFPDARDRLNYVATLTQQAAERVLNATEAAQPVVEKLGSQSHNWPSSGICCSRKSSMCSSSATWSPRPMLSCMKRQAGQGDQCTTDRDHDGPGFSQT